MYLFLSLAGCGVCPHTHTHTHFPPCKEPETYWLSLAPCFFVYVSYLYSRYLSQCLSIQHPHTPTYTQVNAHTHAHRHTRTHTHTNRYTDSVHLTHTYTPTPTYTRTRTPTYTHTHIHTHTHTHAQCVPVSIHNNETVDSGRRVARSVTHVSCEYGSTLTHSYSVEWCCRNTCVVNLVLILEVSPNATRFLDWSGGMTSME